MTSSNGKDVPIFEQPWWLEAATNGQWGQAEVRWDDRLVGWMPYYRSRNRWGLTVITNPPYTHTMTPRLNLPSSKPYKQFENQVRVMRELLERLPDHHRLELRMDPHAPAVYPFVRLGYLAATSYTFRSSPDMSLEAIWSGLDQKTRNTIRTTRQQTRITFDRDIERFIALSRRNHGKEDHNRYDDLRRIWAACQARDQSTIIVVRNQEGQDLAACVVVWDQSHLYYWAAARDRSRSGNGALSVVIWEAMALAHAKGLTFDMDGYDSDEAARALGRFGLTPVVRNVINRSSRSWKLLMAARLALLPERARRDERPYRC